jgi:tetratricopeptide (TPR) repeat protein
LTTSTGPNVSSRTAVESSGTWQAAGELERALPAAIEAGVQAGLTFAFAEARRFYEHALELWGRAPRAAELAPIDRVTLLERAAEAAHLVDDVPRAAELLREAFHEVDGDADPVHAGLLHERLGRYLWMSADQAALTAYEEAVRLVPAEPPSAERARVLAGYAELLGVRRATAKSRQVAEEALATARRVGARREEGRALGSIADALIEADVDGAIALLRDARRIAKEQADVDGVGWASLQLAVLMELTGRLEEALAAALQGAEASRRLGAAFWDEWLLGSAAFLEFLLGRWDEADRHFQPPWSGTGSPAPRGCTRGCGGPGSTSPAATSPPRVACSWRRVGWP